MIAPGDRMPFCAGMAADRQFYSFDVQAGRPAIVVLGGAVASDILAPLVDGLAARRAEVAALGADQVVLRGFAVGPSAFQSGIATVLCQDDFFARCGMSPGAAHLAVIDRAARVVACWPIQDADPAALTQAALDITAQIEREQAFDCLLPAPVLALPGLFTPALCAELIAGFESGANFDSGVSTLGTDGQPTDAVNYGKKRRRDWMLQPGADIHERVLDLLFARCGTEIKRAYQMDVTHADRVLVACYDDTGGYFKRHRDNRGESVAFRQFALSVNLNAGYEGGYLLFPEFNDHRYRPAAGGGIIFSTSLLHEATPVTRGTRYVLLTFLHDTRAETRRVAAIEAARMRVAVPA